MFGDGELDTADPGVAAITWSVRVPHRSGGVGNRHWGSGQESMQTEGLLGAVLGVFPNPSAPGFVNAYQALSHLI